MVVTRWIVGFLHSVTFYLYILCEVSDWPSCGIPVMIVTWVCQDAVQ